MPELPALLLTYCRVLLWLYWPWLGKLGLGRLPGDIFIERGGRLYLPQTSSIIVSQVVNLWSGCIGDRQPLADG
ncbi:MAG TPA: DUF2905 domain-containing protein [Gammaproteobacteria bacterium]|nr:DUF2905 domain-containing protein [Gammaproteobacteria bacterium]